MFVYGHTCILVLVGSDINSDGMHVIGKIPEQCMPYILTDVFLM